MPVKDKGYSNAGRLAAVEKRRLEADARNVARDARSDAEQLRLLDYRPGSAARERARIKRRMEMSR